MAKRISGRDFVTQIGDYRVNVMNCSLSIEDGAAVTHDGGVPNGYVSGKVSASGEIELSTLNFNILVDAAKAKGSWKGMGTFDICFMAKTADSEMRVDAFECLITISDLLNINPDGGEAHTTKLPFTVTSPDFIKINGVPYLESSEIQNLI